MMIIPTERNYPETQSSKSMIFPTDPVAPPSVARAQFRRRRGDVLHHRPRLLPRGQGEPGGHGRSGGR